MMKVLFTFYCKIPSQNQLKLGLGQSLFLDFLCRVQNFYLCTLILDPAVQRRYVNFAQNEHDFPYVNFAAFMA